MLRKIAYLTRVSIVTALVLFFCELPVYADGAKLDFAFPKSIAKDARRELTTAMSKGDGKQALISSIQLTIARNETDKESIKNSIALYDTLSQTLPMPYCDLALVLKAKLMGSNKGDDIRSVLAQAMKKESELRSIPLATLAGLVDNVAQTPVELSVYDFMAINAAQLIARNNNYEGEPIPFVVSGQKEHNLFTQNSKDYLAEDVTYYQKRGDSKTASYLAMCRLNTIGGMTADEYAEQCFELWKDTPYAGPFLLNLKTGDAKERYERIQNYLKRFPNCRSKEELQNELTEMGMGRLMINLTSSVLPKTDFQCNVKISNLSSVYLLLVKMPAGRKRSEYKVSNVKKIGKLVQMLNISTQGEVPFQEKHVVSFNGVESGDYCVVASKTPNLEGIIESITIQPLRVTNIAIITGMNFNGDHAPVIVVDASNMRPISGAKVTAEKGNEKREFVTDKFGSFVFKSDENTQGYYGLTAEYKGNYATGQLPLVNHDRFGNEEWYNWAVLTDISLYRPGSELTFSVIGYTSQNRDLRLACEKEVDVRLRNANMEVVDSVMLRTDKAGRATGKLRIPTDGLLGDYTVMAGSPSSLKNAKYREEKGYAHISVAEYKTPTFMVVTNDLKSQYAVGDTITISGRVVTYAGMPVANRRVTYNITPQRIYGYGPTEAGSFGGNLTTDANGCFSVQLLTSALKNTKFANSAFGLVCSATNLSGETQSSACMRFMVGNFARLSMEIPDQIEVSDESRQREFVVSTYSYDDKPESRQIDFKIMNLNSENDNQVVASGSFMSPSFDFDFASLESGRYRLEFSCDAFPKKGIIRPTTTDIVVYRKNDKHVPYDTPVWLDTKQIVAPKGAKSVSVRVGSAYNDSWILMVATDKDSVTKSEWLRVNDGFVTVKFSAPVANQEVMVQFAGMHNFKNATQYLKILPAESECKMKVEVESFRKNLIPRTTEHWRFRFKYNDENVWGKPGEVYAFAEMSNKAVNSISANEWSFNPDAKRHSSVSFWLNMPYDNQINEYVSIGSRSMLPTKSLIVPEWNFYGMQFGTQYYYPGPYIRGLGASNSLKYSAKIMDTSEGADMYEAVKAESALGDFANQQEPEPFVSMHEVELPVVYYNGNLISNQDGVVEVEFEAPNYNGSWDVQLLGYNRELKVAKWSDEVITSRKIMAQMNAPRYLTAGDKAVFAAQVFNNTNEEVALTARLQVFEPATGKVLAEETFAPEMVQSMLARGVAMDYEVPQGMNYLGLRLWGVSGDYSDGEEYVIPVFPVITPIIESSNFFVKDNEERVSVDLSANKKDAQRTLQYCDNPVWECVTSLNVGEQSNSKNVLTLASSLLDVATTKGLVAQYPEIAEALKIFASHSQDSTLVSRLERNQALKNVMLNNTPWLMDAEDEDARMLRLAQDIEASRLELRASRLVQKITELQNSDGGWSWWAGGESMRFITECVLRKYADLKRLGYLPKELERSAQRAIAYLDDSYIQEEKSSKAKSYAYDSMLDYLWIRSAFKNVKISSGFVRLQNKALASINRNWRKLDLYDKANAAILLSDKGMRKESKLILSSIGQFVNVSPSGEVSIDAKIWDCGSLRVAVRILDAYSQLDPKSSMVSNLRHYLLTQRQALSWSDSESASQVVPAILRSGASWTRPVEPVKVWLDGKRIDTGDVAAYTGSFTLSSNLLNGRELVIERKSGAPAWGSLVMQYQQPASEVKAAGSKTLTVLKQIEVLGRGVDGGLTKDSVCHVGDRVRVTLTLTSNRDLEYVSVVDARAVAFEPVEQLSSYESKDGVWYYREVRDRTTSLFIPFLPKGEHRISYECYVDRSGTYVQGVASAQSLLEPGIAAHTSGTVLKINN